MVRMPSTTLTPREVEIAKLAAEGWDNNYIAQLLVISKTTVSTILRKVYEKLNITKLPGVDVRVRLAKIVFENIDRLDQLGPLENGGLSLEK